MALMKSHPSCMDGTAHHGGGFSASIMMANMQDLCVSKIESEKL